MMGRGTFRKNVAFHKTGTVISGPCCFCCLVEFLTIAWERTVIASITCLKRTDRRHGKKVSEFATPSRTAETHERETDHRTVMNIISGRITALVYGYRTDVYHSKRSTCSRYAGCIRMRFDALVSEQVCIRRRAGSDHRIDISDRVNITDSLSA